MTLTRASLIVVAALCAIAMAGSPAGAQTCGADYVLKDGDSLAKVSQRVYGKSSQWTIIFYANQDRLGANATLLVPGLALRIPCLGGSKSTLPEVATSEAASAAPVEIETSTLLKRIELLTADDYAPFTGRSLPDGGMMTDMLTQAMTLLRKETKSQLDFNISWVNDWSAHLNPLLATRAFDVGFPWYKPPCQEFAELDTDAKYRCQKFFFSDPLFEQLVVFFVKSDSRLKFATDAEIVGKTLCRPSGYWTFDLDMDGRNWVKGKKVTLMQPPSVDECYRLLEQGAVDAVALNEFTGREALIRLDLEDKVRIIEKPIEILTLHVLVAKTHPQARTLLHYVNSALARLKASGDYDRIVDKHLTAFWDAVAEKEQKAAASTSN